MRRTNKKKYGVILFTLILAIGVVAGAYALLNDTVVLNGTATVVEADNVALEIIDVDTSLYVKYKKGFTQASSSNESDYIELVYEDYADEEDDTTGLWTISNDKKQAAIAFGDIDIDTYERFRVDAAVTVKNTGNVPVSITVPSASTNNGVELYTNRSYCDATNANLEGSYEGFTEILAAGAELTFDVSAECSDLESYQNGATLTGSFAVSAEKYTGNETPLGTHTHSSMLGGV